MRRFLTVKGIDGAVNTGSYACLIICILFLAFTILMWQSISIKIIASNLLAVLVWVGLGIGIYKRNRVCAGLALLLYMANELFLLSQGGYGRFNFLWPVFIYAFCQAITGTYLYHRIKKENISIAHRLNRRSLILFAVTMIVFSACFFPAIKFHEHMVKNAWVKYMKQVQKERSQIKLPKKIAGDILLQDIYFEDKTLIFEYDVKDLNNLSMTHWSKETQQDFFRFCWHNIPQSMKMQVLYRFTQGYDKREFAYSARDCQ